MPIYSYKGLNSAGKEVKASITSDSLNSAKSKLRASSIMLIDIKEQKSDSLKQDNAINFGVRVSTDDLALMTRQLATLIRAKIQIVESLSALVDQSDNRQLKIALSEIKQKVNEGSSLAQALADYPTIFDTVYINMVDAGESSGTLEVVLLRLADFTEAQVKLRTKIKGAMMYPMIMMIVGAIMMGIIFVVVIPKITKIFVSMKKELPLQTKICIWISNYLKDYWHITIAGLFMLYWFFKKYIKTKKGKRKWDKVLLKLPQIGPLITMINVSRFCSTLSTLLNAGVPILTSMRIVRNIITNVHMGEAVDAARESISEGGQMAGPLKNSGLFPSMVTHMIGLGERSGEIEPMLNIVAENYEEQVDAKLGGLSSILEPIMMVAMGAAVGFIVFAVVVPMMSINQLK